MKILLAVEKPSFGGHTRSAVAVGNKLRRRGHEIEFLIGPLRSSCDPVLIERAEYPIHRTPGGGAPSETFAHARRVLGDHGFEGTHSFGGRPPYELARAARAEGRFFLWTITSGGIGRAGYLGLNRVVVFTREVAEDARRRAPGTEVHIIPGRIDLRAVRSYLERDVRAETRAQFGIAERTLLVVRVARCSPLYIDSVRLGLGLVERLHVDGRDVAFLHAGYVESEEIAAEIASLVASVNERAGRTIAFSETRDVERASRFMAAADVCIAAGRSAIEAIAMGRPTLISFGEGYAGAVDDRNIETLAHTNFQGRLAPVTLDETGRVEAAYRALNDRLADPEEAARIAEACARFIDERYAVQRAVDRYERLYEDRRVTTHGRLRHYGGGLVRRVIDKLSRTGRGWLER